MDNGTKKSRVCINRGAKEAIRRHIFDDFYVVKKTNAIGKFPRKYHLMSDHENRQLPSQASRRMTLGTSPTSCPPNPTQRMRGAISFSHFSFISFCWAPSATKSNTIANSLRSSLVLKTIFSANLVAFDFMLGGTKLSCLL